MPDLPSTPLRVSDLSASRPNSFDLRPEALARAAIAASLDIVGLRKLRFHGSILADAGQDWRLEATLGATVVQPCVVTLAPVTTRLDLAVNRRYLVTPPEPVLTEDGEALMPEDDTIEPLGPVIDPAAVMIEALALNLSLYPRAAGAELDNAVFAGPGVAPMRDEDARPFAGLAGLRDVLSDKDPDETPDGSS
jgi:uncharacterized metal-binding protein YceD (DUF177 family)